MSFWKNRVEPIVPRPGPWDENALQIGQGARPSDKRGLRSLIIDEYLSSKTFSAGVHIGSRIKPNISKMVRRSMDIGEDDVIKVVFDGTLFGSAKNGFVISADGLYWREFWGSPQFTNWQALSLSQSGRRLSFKSSKIQIDNAVITMSFGFYSAKDLEDIVNGVLHNFHSLFEPD